MERGLGGVLEQRCPCYKSHPGWKSGFCIHPVFFTVSPFFGNSQNTSQIYMAEVINTVKSKVSLSESGVTGSNTSFHCVFTKSSFAFKLQM